MRAMSFRTPLVAALAACGALFTAVPALAQSGCDDGQKMLAERQGLLAQFNKAKGKDNRLDPRQACSALTKLGSNSDALVKWMETNKDWCKVPDDALASFKDEQSKVRDLKGQACKAAAQVSRAEKQQAKQGANPFGGGLTGEYKIPQGAL